MVAVLRFLPDVRRGTHQDVVEQEEASLLGLDDLAVLVVNRLHHVVRADQVAAAAAEELKVMCRVQKKSMSSVVEKVLPSFT